MARAARCPICRGPLTGPFGEAAAGNRRYCSGACRTEAYRRRRAGITPAAARRAEQNVKAEVDQAAASVLALISELDDEVDGLRYAVDRRTSFVRASYTVRGLAERVEQLAAAAVAYDRALGVTWAELAEDTGVDESTLRRRQHRAAEGGA